MAGFKPPFGGSGGGGGAPSGPAGGALQGTYPSPTLAADAVATVNISDGAVTFAKLQAAGTYVVLSNDGTGTTYEEHACTAAAFALLDDADVTTMRSTLGLTIGTNVQAWDADLDAYAALSGAGIVAHTGAGAASLRTLTGTANFVTVTNGDGAAGNPTFTVASTYPGGTSIASVGTLTAGTWNATPIAIAYGGTNLTSYAKGDLLYGIATNTLAALAGNITTTPKALLQTGSGAASAAPAWTAIPTSIAGTSARVTASASTGAIVIDIDATYVGQTSITKVGTVTTGTWNATKVGTAYGGTALDTSAAANGTLLIGNGAGLSLSTLTAGTGITITNAGGGITITNAGATYTDEMAQDAVGSILTDTSTIDFTYDDAGNTITAIVIDNSITDAKLRAGTARSVIGRGGATGGNVADIVAGADNDVLRRASGVVGFGTISTGSIGSGQLATANGGTGLDTSSAANGVLLIGNGSGLSAATLTAGTGISVSNSSGGIQISNSSIYTDEQAQDAVGAALTDTSTIDFTYTDGANTITADIVANSVGNSMLRTGAATSVIGRAGALMGNVADIAGTTDGDVLWLNGTTLSFGALTKLGTVGTGTWQATKVGVTYGGTGVDGSSAAKGALLIGNASGYTLNTLTAGSNVTITNGTGTITIAASGGTGTVTSVGITAPAAGITSSGGPITTSGNITLALADDLSALEAMSGTGLVARTASNTYAQRTLTGTTNGVTVTNGDGVSSNPTFDVSTTYAGGTSIVTLGTVTSGTWQATTVASGFGGTGFSAYTLGDTIYSSATNTLAKLAGNTTTTVKALLQTGNGTVSAAPAWTAIPTSIAGTTNRLTASASTGAVTLDISSSYAGQSTIVTTGALTSGSTGAGFTVALSVATVTGTLDFPTYIRGIPGLCGFRLTLESGVALSTTAQTAKTTIYLTPCPWASCGAGMISNYESSVWVPRKRVEVSASLSGLTASLPYDVFAYDASGTFTLDLVAWSTATARATALATQDGVYVKTGATSRLYVGTILITATTGQCEFNRGSSAALGGAAFIGFQNAFNPVLVECAVIDSTASWTYNNATWRSKNNSTTNRITFIQGILGSGVSAQNCWAGVGGTSSDASGSLGLNSTSAVATNAGVAYAQAAVNATGIAMLKTTPAVGTNYVQAIESRLGGTNAGTYYGTSTGNLTSSLNASLWC